MVANMRHITLRLPVQALSDCRLYLTDLSQNVMPVVCAYMPVIAK